LKAISTTAAAAGQRLKRVADAAGSGPCRSETVTGFGAPGASKLGSSCCLLPVASNLHFC